MSRSVHRLVLGTLSALAVIAGAASMPAEAKGGFKPFFTAKLPGEPKGASSWKATTKGEQGKATKFIYNDAVGSLTLNGVAGKPGLTTTIVQMNVNVFAGMDLTDVTFPVTRPALVVFSYTKTKLNIKNPAASKTTAYNYSTASVNGATVTVTSYDATTGEMTGTLQGDMEFHENAQDPKDDARDGEIVTFSNAKFALKAFP